MLGPALVLVVALIAACGPRDASRPDAGATVRRSFDAAVATSSPRGNPARGGELVRRFECNRCHEGTALEPRAAADHCVQCHRAILSGRGLEALGVPVAPADLATWRSHLHSLNVAPSLVAVGERFRPDWLVAFLVEPHDLRPALRASMPRLALAREDARDIVAFFAASTPPPAEAALDRGRAAEGRRLLEVKGCASCHAFTGVPALPATASAVAVDDAARADAVLLAPDLAIARDRLAPGALVEWLMHPSRIKPDTLMPTFGLSRADAEAIAAYLFFAERTPPPRPAVPARLPVLTRRVTFAEVDERIFRAQCWHCHSDAGLALGSGGPGNTGGFGFAGRGVDLSSFAKINSGYRDAEGRRRSLFEDLGGVPRLVAALLARHEEEAGHPVPGVRGMPLGLPPRSFEDIQLVETWIAQGRPE